MHKADVEAIGALVGDGLAAGGGLIKEMHEGIASRPFQILGPSAAPARMLHDGISRAVYGTLRGGLRAASRGAATLVALRITETEAPLDATPAGSVALGGVNGLYGNHIWERGNRLAFEMQLRREGATVSPTREGLASAFPDATSRVAVFVHGLCENDESWRHFPLRGDRTGRRTYGERLQDELSFTPIHLRYNTGLRVSHNGRRLARLLEQVVAAWPVAVEELVLVGHSMGGLVARSACHYGEEESLRFVDAVRHVFCLGSPHLGADLEKGANALAWALGRLPETRALGSFLNARSVGIKDMRFGSCIDEDWHDCDPDEYLRDRCQEVPFLPAANYYFIAATLYEGRLGAWLGDLLVRMPSSSGQGTGKGRRIPFEVDNGHELSGINHFDLLNHPAVYEQLRTWITRAARRPALPALPPAQPLLELSA